MRIVFITSSSNMSGGSRQALYLAQGLAARGHDLVFFVPVDAALPALAPDFAWRRLPEKRRAWRQAVAATLPKQRPAVLHAFHNKAVKLAAWWGLFWRRRGLVVAAQRGVVYAPNNPLPYWSPGIDCFMVNSHACATVLKRKGVADQRLHVVHNAVPAERLVSQLDAATVLKKCGVGQGNTKEFVFGCVANDSANKGVDLLLAAFARASLPEARLVVVGVSEEKWRPLCLELGVEERVALLGPSECVADYLRACDVFVLASHSESMPNTVQEAMCLGLPVVVTGVGGVPECVDGNGLLVPPGDVAALAAALQTSARDAAERAAWAARSLEMSALFDLNRKIDRVEAIYRDIFARRRLPWS